MKTNKLFQSHSSSSAGSALNGLRFAALGLALLLPASLHAVSAKFTSSGSFTPPAGITSITVEVWGGGGAGGSAQKITGATGNAGAGGGGGGAYAKKINIPVTPGTPYTVTIPAAAVAPASGFTNTQQCPSGANVTFTGDAGVSVTANGGTGGACAVSSGSTAITGAGGAGGAVSGSFDVEWAGGVGGSFSAANGGPGGSGASDLQNGKSRPSGTTLSGGTTPGSDTDHDGGAGGPGKTGSGAGNAGAAQPGGAGGGAKCSAANTIFAGAAGTQGQVIISYVGPSIVKADNTTNLNLGTSWVGGTAPAGSDTAKWDATVTSANTTVLGANVAWGAISIVDPAGLVTINAGNTLQNNGNIDMSAATADLTLNCGYVLGNGAVWNVASGRTLTVNGAISGASGKNLTMQGDGMVILSGSNTYSGITALVAGSTGLTLKLGTNNVIPDGTNAADVTIGFGCTLDLNGKSETINGLLGTSSGSLISLIDNTAAGTTSTLTVGVTQAVATTTFAGILQNTGAGSTLNFVKTGVNQLTLQKANTLTGTVNVNGGGTLAVQNATPFDSISNLILGGSTFMCIGSATLPAPVTLTSNTTFNVGGNASGTLTLNGPVGGAGDIKILSAANTVGDAPLVILGATNTFTGNVTIDSNPSSTLNSMTVRLGASNALPSTAVLTLDGQNATSGNHWADLDLNGNNQTLAGLTNVTRTGSRLQRVYSTADATLTINNSANYTFSGTLGNSDVSGNALALVKTGAGTFTLSSTTNTFSTNSATLNAANTYANGTAINAGTLLVNTTTNSGTGSGTVVINSGGTLGGTGGIDGAVTNNAGGTLAPGAAGVGTLTLNSDLILSAGSTNTFEVDGTAATNDTVVLSLGAATYGGVLKIVPTGSFVNGQTFTLVNGTGATNASQFSSLIVSPTVSGTSFTFTNGVLTAVVAPVGPTGPGTITNSFSGGTLSLSWPAGQGWRLQQQTNSLTTGLGTNWTYVTDGSSSSTNIPVNSARPAVFYRLTYP